MWGLHPPPIQRAADSQLFAPSPLRGPETPVRGINSAKPFLQPVHVCLFVSSSCYKTFFEQDSSYSPILGVTCETCRPDVGSASVTRAAFLGHSPHVFIHSQLRPRKARPLSPVALPGRPLPSCPAPPSHVHCRVTRSSHQPGAGCPFCPWEASEVSSG